MKLVVRIFNLVFIALSVTALILLFTLPSFSFYSNVGIDIKKISEFVPKTEYSEGIKIDELIGTDTIHVGIQFSLSVDDLHKCMNNDKDTINEELITNNIEDIIDILHEPVDLITEYAVRYIVKSLAKAQIELQIESALAGTDSTSTAKDIMDEIGLDDAYFTKLSENIYSEADKDNATIDAIVGVIFEQVDDALTKADELGEVDVTTFGVKSKENIKENVVNVFSELKLTDEVGHVTKISEISYKYFASFLKSQLDGKVKDASTLEKKSNETNVQYAGRLVGVYVTTLMPDAFYTVVSYVSLGLFIGLFVFAGIWALLLVFTVIKTLTPKPWTFFGPLFWIAGLLEIVLGLGLTIAFKFVLPKTITDFGSLPINSIALAPRTYALALSIIFLVVFVLAIPYAFVKHGAKKAYKEAKRNEEN